MYFRTRVQIPAPPISIEGLRPSNSPTRALARRFDGSLRSRGSLALARSLAYSATIYRGASPLEFPYTRSRSPLRRLAPIAWLVRCAHSRPVRQFRRERAVPCASTVRGRFFRRNSFASVKLPAPPSFRVRPCLDQANDASRARGHRLAAACRCASVTSAILAPAPTPASMMFMIS